MDHRCSSGDIHGLFGYYDGRGRLHRTPAFTSHLGQFPAILEDRHYVRKRTRATVLHSMGILVPHGGEQHYPLLDVLRDDSTTACKRQRGMGGFRAKTAGGSPISTGYSDAGALLSAGTNQATSSLGAGDWTGERNQLVRKVRRRFGVHSGETGDILGRICSPRPPSGLIPSSRPDGCLLRISAGGAWVPGRRFVDLFQNFRWRGLATSRCGGVR